MGDTGCLEDDERAMEEWWPVRSVAYGDDCLVCEMQQAYRYERGRLRCPNCGQTAADYLLRGPSKICCSSPTGPCRGLPWLRCMGH